MYVSLVFDVVFLLQHYVFYGPREVDENYDVVPAENASRDERAPLLE
jgi:hypothetical protein